MGQKIHPTGFRLAVSRNWASRWYANNNNFAAMLQEDIGVREYLKKKLKNASVGRVIIERPAKKQNERLSGSRVREFPSRSSLSVNCWLSPVFRSIASVQCASDPGWPLFKLRDG